MFRPEALCVLLLAGAGCDQAMTDQPKRKPYQASAFFADGRSSRLRVEGTVPQGGLRLDDPLHRGTTAEGFTETFPFDITAGVLARGRERYDIFCSPCHDRTGSGHGIIVERGFRPPPSYHLDRLRAAPAGKLFDVITNGLGAMPPHGDQIPVPDRWAIVAYVRALQLSRDGRIDLLPEAERRRLEAEPP